MLYVVAEKLVIGGIVWIYPPWLEKILKFTPLKWLEMLLISPVV